MANILSIITARAGSKGIKHKNVRLLCGKPLVEWSIIQSLQSRINKTVVNSNCPLVKQVCDKYNQVQFIQRPEEFATDLSKNEDALLHTLNYLDDSYNIVINLQPTSPIRDNNLINKCIEKMIDEESDSLFTAKKYKGWWFRVEDGKVIMIEEGTKYHDDGNVYCFTEKLLRDTNCRMGGKISIFETNKYQALQIDTEEDFKLIEKTIKTREESAIMV